MKFMKVKVVNNLSKKIPIFVLSSLLLSGGLYWMGKIKVNPKAYERVNLMISSINLNNKLLEEKMMESNKVDVKEINVTFSIYDSSSMSMVYNTVFSEMDCFIFPKTFLDNRIETSYLEYAKIDETVVSNYISSPSFYEYEGNKYGIKVYDSLLKKGWCDSIIRYFNDSFNEDYYLFFNKKSVNLGEMNDSSFDSALDFMKAMKEYEEEK